MSTPGYRPAAKSFFLMAVGEIITLIGSGLLRFVMSLYVLDITGRPDVFATLYAITSIPLLLAPIGGAIADRFNRRKLMVLIDFTNGVVMLVFIIMMFIASPSVLSVGIVMVLLTVISSMDSPLSMACIPSLVSEDKLEQANGIVSGVGAVSQVVAPVLGGMLYGVMSLKTLVIFSCTAFFLASFMESFIQIHFVKREISGHIVLTIINDIKEGFSYAVKQPFILKPMILAALLNMILSPLFFVGAPIILRIVMQSSDMMYAMGMSLINMAVILGSIITGLFVKRLRMNIVYRWLIVIALLLLPIALSVMPFMIKIGYYPAFMLFILGAIPIAMIMTVLNIFIVSSIQKKTSNENLGKVMSIVMVMAQCAAPIGQVAYGVLFGAFQTMVYLPILFIEVVLFIMAAVVHRNLKNERGIIYGRELQRNTL